MTRKSEEGTEITEGDYQRIFRVAPRFSVTSGPQFQITIFKRRKRIMQKEQLELKRSELNLFLDNFSLSSEVVVKKAREFEELANRIYKIKDGAFWMERAKKLEGLLKEAADLCPENYKNEIKMTLEVE